MLEKRKFLFWFLIFCSLGFASALGYHYGLWQMMYAKDSTMISWIITVIAIASTLCIGYYAYGETASTDVMNRLWFISDAMVTLGMIGTVAGFLIMMGDGFASLDSKDSSAIQETIKTVARGMGTILITTLVGLVASLVLKLQLVIIDNEK